MSTPNTQAIMDLIGKERQGISNDLAALRARVEAFATVTRMWTDLGQFVNDAITNLDNLKTNAGEMLPPPQTAAAPAPAAEPVSLPDWVAPTPARRGRKPGSKKATKKASKQASTQAAPVATKTAAPVAKKATAKKSTGAEISPDSTKGRAIELMRKAGKPIMPSDIVKKMKGVSASYASVILTELKKIGRVKRDPNGWVLEG